MVYYHESIQQEVHCTLKSVCSSMSRVLSTPLHLSHLKTPPGYTLPAPLLAGSPCNQWILQHVCFKEIFLFRISGVTFEVSSCTKFQMTQMGELTALHRLPSWWGGGSLPPSCCPSPIIPPPISALRASGFKLRPLPVTHTPSCKLLDKTLRLSVCRLPILFIKVSSKLKVGILCRHKCRCYTWYQKVAYRDSHWVIHFGTNKRLSDTDSVDWGHVDRAAAISSLYLSDEESGITRGVTRVARTLWRKARKVEARTWPRKCKMITDYWQETLDSLAIDKVKSHSWTRNSFADLRYSCRWAERRVDFSPSLTRHVAIIDPPLFLRRHVLI